MLLRQLCQYKGTLYTHQKAALVTQFCKIVQLMLLGQLGQCGQTLPLVMTIVKNCTSNAAKATQQMQMNIINSFARNISYKLFKIVQLLLLRQLWLCKGAF